MPWHPKLYFQDSVQIKTYTSDKCLFDVLFPSLGWSGWRTLCKKRRGTDAWSPLSIQPLAALRKRYDSVLPARGLLSPARFVAGDRLEPPRAPQDESGARMCFGHRHTDGMGVNMREHWQCLFLCSWQRKLVLSSNLVCTKRRAFTPPKRTNRVQHARWYSCRAFGFASKFAWKSTAQTWHPGRGCLNGCTC